MYYNAPLTTWRIIKKDLVLHKPSYISINLIDKTASIFFLQKKTEVYGFAYVGNEVFTVNNNYTADQFTLENT